jgi:2-oxoglutarate ferredoxin oxidoreductase subunit delta
LWFQRTDDKYAHFLEQVIEMPILYQEQGQMLCLQFERCKGCDLCINICPKKVLEKSETLNRNVQYPPTISGEKKCTFCKMCQYVCPDFSIYVVSTEEA